MNERELRFSEFVKPDVNTDDKQEVTGYALLFDNITILFEENGVQYKEVIARGALDNADISDVPFKYNHSENVMIMARTRNNTLKLSIDEKGLFICADLAKTSVGRDMYQLIARGDIDKMSFAFTVIEDSYDILTHTRTILKIGKLYDVSAVDLPAYEDTSINVRSYFNEKIQKQEIERLKKIIAIQTRL